MAAPRMRCAREAPAGAADEEGGHHGPLAWVDVPDATSDLHLYMLLAVAALLENLAPFLPGDLTVLWGGTLVSVGRIDPVLAVLALTPGAWLGFMLYCELARVLPRHPAFGRQPGHPQAHDPAPPYGHDLPISAAILP